MEPTTLVLIGIAVLLGVLAIKLLAGVVKTVVKAALLVLAVYLVFTFAMDADKGPTGLSVQNGSVPTAAGPAPQQEATSSQYLPDCTTQDGQDSCGLP